LRKQEGNQQSNPSIKLGKISGAFCVINENDDPGNGEFNPPRLTIYLPKSGYFSHNHEMRSFLGKLEKTIDPGSIINIYNT